MAEKDLRTSIQDALQACAKGNLAKSAVALLNTLGYRSEKTYAITPNTADQFKAEFDPGGRLNDEKALTAQWKSVDILFQVADDELQDAFSKQPRIFAETALNTVNIESYLFFAVDLSEDYYARTDIANITREINKLFPMPVMVVMRHGGKLSIGIITRRVNKRDASRDVLEKVTLIKAIRAVSPHRAHVEILNDLSLPELAKSHPLASFVDLQRAWEKTLDTSELNKKFYREVADWYFWAVGNVQFPEGGEPDVEKRNATNVIRLITRLIFVWFIKEKGLVPEDLFNPQRLKAILKPGEARNGIYYKAILQNLFFATLNTEMGSDRRFRGKNHSGGRDAHYGISTVYRYEDAFIDPAAALKLFAAVPFLNGGLFECLDKREQKLLVDGFSDDSRNQPVVPDTLFFGEARDVNLNQVYGDTRHGREKVRGLIHIFNSYKFTIEENTPLEEEIALDPELLGKVFENLLAAYNPETGTTARKQTGSFYTPREIVNYMVDESLIAYLETKLVGTLDAQQRLRHLLDYNQEPHQFTEAEAKRLIDAIDGVKVLDPACGSGAFPMGVLHKLVFILSKIDPGNLLWKQRQIDKAAEIPDPSIREQVIEDIEKSFRENELDYGRKLYLIQNCIYGVDIQPIAVQIAKLRFFISLVVDQRTDPRKPNLGIRPLPNLETKFVAANTLIGIDRPQSAVLRDEPSLLIADDVREKCNLLVEKFRQYLLVRTPSLKESLLADGVRLGAQINQALINDPDWIPIQVEWIFNTAKKVDELRNALPLQQKEKVAEVQFVTAEIKSLEDRLAWVRSEIFTARTPATKHKYRDMDRQLRVDIAKLLKDDGWGSDTASLLAGWDPYDQNTSADFFDPEWMFGTSNGFDIVIGNPPWGAKLTPKEKEDFKNAYKEIDSSTPNTFAYFIGWGLRNISNNMSFVLPDSILIKDFEKTRKLIKDYVSEIIWYENAGIPEEYKPFVYVDHDVCVINITKSFSKSLRYSTIRYERVNNCLIEKKNIVDKDRFILGDFNYAINLIAQERDLRILEKIRRYTKAEDFLQCHEGIHTGNSRDILFVRQKKSDRTYSLFYGAGAGDFIDNYFSRPSGWLVDYREEIIDKKKGNYASLRDERIFKYPKIYITRTGYPFKAFIDVSNYASNNFFSLQYKNYSENNLENLKYVIPFIVSRIAQYFIRTFAAPRLGSTFVETKIIHLLKFCIPTRVDESTRTNIINKVTEIMETKCSIPLADTTDLETQLNQMVYQLYNLTEDEIAIVEGRA